MIRNVQNEQTSLDMFQRIKPKHGVFTMLIANKIRVNSPETKDSGTVSN